MVLRIVPEAGTNKHMRKKGWGRMSVTCCIFEIEKLTMVCVRELIVLSIYIACDSLKR